MVGRAEQPFRVLRKSQRTREEVSLSRIKRGRLFPEEHSRHLGSGHSMHTRQAVEVLLGDGDVAAQESVTAATLFGTFCHRFDGEGTRQGIPGLGADSLDDDVRIEEVDGRLHRRDRLELVRKLAAV